MFSYFFRTYFPGQRSFWSKKKDTKLYARDLLGSIASDVDLVLDWWFLYDVLSDEHSTNVPNPLRVAHILFTIFGTVTWLFLSTDGRAISWFIMTPILSVQCIWYTLCGKNGCVAKRTCCLPLSQLWNDTTKESNLQDTLKLSSGFLLLTGILVEDLPQIILSFLVKSWLDADTASGERGGLFARGDSSSSSSSQQLSGLVVANLLTSIYNACIKLADAYDQREDIIIIDTVVAPVSENSNRSGGGGSGGSGITLPVVKFEKGGIRSKLPSL